MYIEQLYTNCLAEAAYYIESEGEAMIIDPLRDIQPYLKLAEERNAKIRYIFETHFHADFVSGHIDLAAETGATIIYGPTAQPNYEAKIAYDGEIISLGKIQLKVLHTPGHTIESSCLLLIDENGKENAIFTGDTLFVGDVGRPDLAVKSNEITERDLANMLYDSIQSKIKPLADDVIVYPAHGPGSQCGKNLGKETWSTIGEQRQSNYALSDISREEFIEVTVEGLLPPPKYFFNDARINKLGYDPFSEVLSRNNKPLNVEEVSNEIQNGAIVLDTRHADSFEQGHIPNAINIGLDGTYAVWVGTVIDIDKPLIIVADAGREEESIMRLARVGYENVKGYLNGGIEAWFSAGKPISKIESITPEEFKSLAQSIPAKILDVRRPTEYQAGHLPEAQLLPVDEIPTKGQELEAANQYYVHCAGGYRSMIACSMLKAQGIENVVNVKGGFNKIKEVAPELIAN